MTDRPESSPMWHADVAYILPMAIFLAFTAAATAWPAFFPASYILKTILTAAALVVGWRFFTRISWNYWWLGILVGIIGVVQWVGMELWVQHICPNYPRLPAAKGYNPFEHFGPAGAWAFIAVRWGGSALVVPVMEELFWRDFLWRTAIAPSDFKLAQIGEWDWKAFLLVAFVFGAGVHTEWMTAIVWGLMIGTLLLYTKSIGACIIAHGVTNFLLGGWVLWQRQWDFW